MRLKDVVSGIAQDGDDLAVETPDTWTQGRTLYGGMTAALCFEAAKPLLPDRLPLRSAQFTFVGPASGRLRLRPEILRQGRSATVLGVDCRTEQGLAARALFTFGGLRESQVVHDQARAPEVAPPDACEAFMPAGPPPKSFFQNFDLRLAGGARPFTPGAEPRYVVWVRHKDASGVDPITAILALADALPPAAMVAFPAPAMISTMTWTLDFARQPTSGEGWCLLTSDSEQAADGYSLQPMALYDADGEHVASGRQMVAIFA